MGATLFYTWVGQLVPQKEVQPPEVVPTPDGPLEILLTGFVVAVLVPIGEELFFRAGMQPWLGWAITSVVFGVVHIGPGALGHRFGFKGPEEALDGCVVPAIAGATHTGPDSMAS